MKSDAFFVKGQSHDICQDYAIARGDTIAVSDGCSLINNNGKCYKHPHSDISSRLVCLSAVNATYDLIEDLILLRSYTNIEMDATLLKACVKDKEINLTIIGDGVIYIKHANREHRIIVISYEPNTPTYLSYLLDKRKSNMFLASAPVVTNMIYIYDNNWNIKDTSKVQEPLNLEDVTVSFDNSKMKATTISLFSDGVTDIYTPNGKLPVKDAVKALVSYKRTNGEFVLARMKAQLRDWASQGIYSNDDLSMATLILD